MKTLKQYLGYAAAALTAALVVTLATAGGGGMLRGQHADDEDDEYVSEVFPMEAGKRLETPEAVLKLVRMGAQYDAWGNPQVIGASMIEFKAAPKKPDDPKVVVARRIYFCKPRTFVTESVTVIDAKGKELVTSNGLVVPQPVDKDATANAEFKFMCDVPRRACTAKDCV